MSMMKIWDNYDDQYGPARSARPRVNRRVYPAGTMFSLGCADSPQKATWGDRLGCPPCLAAMALADSALGCCGNGGQCLNCPCNSLGDDTFASKLATMGTLGTLGIAAAAVILGMVAIPPIISILVHGSRKRKR